MLTDDSAEPHYEQPQEDPGGEDEPIVVRVGTPDRPVVDESLRRLRAAGANIYERNGQLVKLTTREKDGTGLADHSKWKPDGSTFTPVRQLALRELITDLAKFVRPLKDGKHKPVEPPAWLPGMIEQRGAWPELRLARGLVEWPALVGSSLALRSGYLEQDRVIARIPEHLSQDAARALAKPMTQDRARKAAETLLEPFSDFPLMRDKDTGKDDPTVAKSALLALILTLVGRYAYGGNTPMFAVVKNQKGAGGSMLVNAVSVLVTGSNIAVIQQHIDPIEERKALFSLLLMGDHMALIDNVTHPVGGANIDSMLTAGVLRDRILSTNTMVDAPNTAVWCVTGNNVEFQPDTVRRHIPIRIFSPTSTPAERSDIAYPGGALYDHIRKNRGKLLSAAVGILWGWHCAGRPKPAKLMGSFEGWSELVVGALEWAGYPSPVPSSAGNADPERTLLQRLYVNWTGMGAKSNRGAGSFIGSGKIIRTLYTDMAGAEEADALREIVEGMCLTQGGKHPSAKSLGHKLGHLAGQVFEAKCGLTGKVLPTKLVRKETNEGALWGFDNSDG